MQLDMTVLLIFLILLYFNVALCRSEWVNPFNMNVDVPRIQEECTCDTPKALSIDLLRYKRSINLLLSSVNIDRTDPSVYKGQLLINIPVENYDFLRQFTKESMEDPVVLQKVDYILDRMFTKPTIERLTEVMLSWSEYLYFTVFNRATGILLTVLLITFFCYKLLKANWTLWLIIKYLLFLGWVTDFAFTWIHLLQESEINKIADTLRYGDTPPECDPNKINFLQYFLSAFSKEDECRRYHQLVLKDIFWTVRPFTIFAHQFGQIILTPASYIGGAVSNLTKGMLDGLFWPLNIILLPILLLFTLILICITLSFVTRTTFKVNLFHLMQFSFGSEERKAMGDVLSAEHLMKLIDGALHRPMIEEVKPSKKHSKPSKNYKALKNVPEDKVKGDKKIKISGPIKTKLQSESELDERCSDPKDHRDRCEDPKKSTKINDGSSELLSHSFCEALGKESFDESSSTSSNSINMSNNSISSSDLDINKY